MLRQVHHSVGHLNRGLLLLVSLLPGCATSGMLSKFSGRENVPRATAADPAVRCLCVWQTAEGTDPDGRPCRGVAGQVFFFSRNSAIPVAVDGDVKVYVFDDQGTEEEQSRPIAQYDVDSATWNSQLSKTQFGPAYRVFVPHTRPGRQETHMAIRLRMTPKSGPPVFSDLSTIELSGPKSALPKSNLQTETAAKVEQSLRSQFAGREQPGSRITLPRDDARSVAANVMASNRQTGETVAMIRPARNDDRPEGAQFQVAPPVEAFDNGSQATSKRIKLRPSPVANENF